MLLNEYCFEDITIGMKESFQVTITRKMEECFRELSGDKNPLHYDDNFCNVVTEGKLSRHVSYGMLTASFYSTVAGMYIPGKYSLIHSFEEISFMKPVFEDDVLSIISEVIDKEESIKMIRVKSVIKNQSNQSVSRAIMKILVLK